jgi:acyl carrier protein
MYSRTIKLIIKDFLKGFIDISKVSDKTDIFASGLINSLFAMQLILFIEEKFNFQISNDDLKLDNFRTIDSITSFIQKKTN